MDANRRPDGTQGPPRPAQHLRALSSDPAPASMPGGALPTLDGTRLSRLLGWFVCALALFGALAWAVSTTWTQDWDEALMLGLDARATPALTEIALGLTDLGSWPVVAVVGLVATGFLWAYGETRAALLLWVALLCTLLLDDYFKEMLARERPDVFDWRTERARGGSYPSGHTLNATVGYALFAYHVARLARSAALRVIAIFLSAALICGVAFSRVYLGVHFPSDVAGGFLLGVAWVLANIAILVVLDRHARS